MRSEDSHFLDVFNLILRILQESETTDFGRIAAGDKFLLQYVSVSSTIFVRSPADVIPKPRQTFGKKRFDHAALPGKESIDTAYSTKR
jgi:hypothetical protein